MGKCQNGNSGFDLFPIGVLKFSYQTPSSVESGEFMKGKNTADFGG